MKTNIVLAAACLMGLATGFAIPAGAAADSRPPANPVRVVLIGASIGKSWDLPGLPARIQGAGVEFETLQAWEYDKSEVLDEVLMRPSRKFHLTRTYLKGFFQPSPPPPDVIVLKECSAYFPGEIQPRQKQELMDRWVREVRQKNIRVVLATAVPVTRQRAAKDPGKQEGVLAFNDWIREYSRKNDIPLLDLEAALRTDDRERYLRDEFAIDDGSHVNRKAYDVLDRVMWETVCSASRAATCQ